MGSLNPTAYTRSRSRFLAVRCMLLRVYQNRDAGKVVLWTIIKADSIKDRVVCMSYMKLKVSYRVYAQGSSSMNNRRQFFDRLFQDDDVVQETR